MNTPIDATTTLQTLLASQPLSALVRRFGALRGSSWDALVRVALAVETDADLDPQRQIRWDALRPASLDAPVTEADLRGYLAARPPLEGVRFLASFFSVRDPRAVTHARLVELVTELYPDALPEALPHAGVHDPLAQPLFARPGAVLGEACARRKHTTPGLLFASLLQFATDDARGAYLRDAADAVTAYELQDLGGWLAPRAAELPAWIREAYARALVASAARCDRGEEHALVPYAALLDGAGVAALLGAATKHVSVFALVSARLAIQGLPQCADGLCALLDDAKRGRAAALTLASMGAEGRRAAHAWLDARAGGKPTRGAALARAVATLPAPPVSLFAGNQYSLPRYGREPRAALLPAAPVPTALLPPTPLATLEAAIAEKPDRTLLGPDGFADLLQLVALEPSLEDVPYAYARALAKGRLGLGAAPAALVAALDELHWGCSVTRHASAYEWGVGHLLVWAGASRAVYVHGIERFVATRTANVVGALDRHFGRALRDRRPRWSIEPVAALVRHYEIWRNEDAWLGPPRVLARSSTPAAEVELTTDARDLWIRGEVTGATRFVIGFRGAMRVAVDVAAERWSLGATPEAEGATPPLDPARGVRFVIEMARDLAYLGIDGALASKAIERLPTTPGPVSVRAEGAGARVVSLELLEKFQVAGVDAAGALLTAPSKAQSHAEVAGQRSPEAAHLLAAAALVLDEPGAGLARAALATMKGEGIEPWQRAVAGDAAAAPEGAKKPAKKPATKAGGATPLERPAEFTVRSFEDVVRAFDDAGLGLKARAKKPAPLRRGQTQQVDLEYASRAPHPETEDSGARTAVPHPVVYLDEGDELGALPKAIDRFLDAVARLPGLCRKGRGTAADVEYVERKGQYLVASLRIVPPDGDDGFDALFFTAFAAAWKVDEGWAWALLEDDEAALAALMGMRALPARVEWKSENCAVLGGW